MPTKSIITPKDIELEFHDIFEYSLERFREGAEEHGNFNPETDARNDFKEILDELSDSIIYLMMFITKLRRVYEKTDKVGYRHEIEAREPRKSGTSSKSNLDQIDIQLFGNLL
jgi:hypothetical protein